MMRFVLVLLFTFALGGICFDYCLDTYVGEDVHWVIDGSVGLVTSVVVIPGAVIGVILVSCDFETPIFNIRKKPVPVCARYHQNGGVN